MFNQGRLVRGQQGQDPRRVLFAVVKLDTTGFAPLRGDRVCEVAVLRMWGDGRVEDEFATVVNPQRRIGNSDHHGIDDAMAAAAPMFPEIAGELVPRLSDAVVVSHNLPYVDGFLQAEFRHAGIPVGPFPALCTLFEFRRHIDLYRYRQDTVFQEVTGSWPAWQQSSLVGARNLGHLFRILVTEAPQPLAWVGPTPAPQPMLPRTGRIAPRPGSLRRGEEGWLANLAAGLPDMRPSPPPEPQAAAEYRAVLVDALADGRIVGEEAQRLARLATRAGFTRSTVKGVHEQVLAEARARAEADGVVTSAELRELTKAAEELGTRHLVGDLLEVAEKEKSRRNGPLKGWRIVPAGESAAVREVVDSAAERGATIGVNITKTVRLVVADPSEEHRTVARAREAGIPVAAPPEAARILDAAAAEARTSLFDDARESARAADVRERDERREEMERRTGWHRTWRPRELSDDEYYRRFVAPFEDDEEDGTAVHVSARGAASQDPRHHARKSGGGCAGAVFLVLAVAAVLALASRVPAFPV
ncbi:3'-5' exonuclease [Nocardiopsis sp. RSe5-2]|uniref:3'-5' exonuclease n=1 Tax=Nocardiopsis endophytica TaxID=3018445 RepID=A0ABT4U122_9ACTN|nr:3'-5' exonuclease [Nocardiopsis endophytica]MDA2810647.1 3'-5' exonuclease [Nocardiopsis endophytica]